MEASAGARIAAEIAIRAQIDAHLIAGAWSVQDSAHTNLFATQGVAVREVTIEEVAAG